MRYLKLASAKNDNDYIDLNGGYFDSKGDKSNNFTGFYGLLCTQFKTLGLSRKHETLQIENRQFTVNDKLQFKQYSLTIEILTSYSLYDNQYRQLISFFERNRKNGFRLYYKPNEAMTVRYCLCDIVELQKTEKRQPVTLTLQQNSLWLSTQKKAETQAETTYDINDYQFKEREKDYYFIEFKEDDTIEKDYYCVSYVRDIAYLAQFEIDCYEEIPINFYIYPSAKNEKGVVERPINNPIIQIIDENNVTIKEFQIFDSYDEGYIEINSNINDNGVFYVHADGTKDDISYKVNRILDSPYVYLSNGKYTLKISDSDRCIIFYNEEYNE